MKNLLLFLLVVAFINGTAQSSDNTVVGKFQYFEGKVTVGSDDQWVMASIDGPVKKNQVVRTEGDAMAEIIWKNGITSVVGPGTQVEVNDLMNGSTSSAKLETAGSFDNFKRIFADSGSRSRTQEGGIRRNETEQRQKPAKDEIYWKDSPEVTFDQGYKAYEAEDYSKAITLFKSFLDQKPNDEMARYASFAMGHSYVMMNNPIKAKEIFERFVVQYSDDELKAEAEAILKVLQ